MNIITRTSLMDDNHMKDRKPYGNAKLVVFEALSDITWFDGPIGQHGIWPLESRVSTFKDDAWSYDPPFRHYQTWVTDDTIETILDSEEVENSSRGGIIVSESPVPDMFPLAIEIYDDYRE